ncbi:tautomerase family protein [Virgibacillus sp. Bac332]|uniref:tautomerase family protein n=1 Tax=Virgibacillus sp. Bac332 TaxID=2419842 RepID=UPI001F089853|nr:tautomerase family protein [Virgibacillus sp. Bac332]
MTCGSGRTQKQKQLLYKELSNQLSMKCNVSTEDVFVVLIETGLKNWFFGEGLAQMVK